MDWIIFFVGLCVWVGVWGVCACRSNIIVFITEKVSLTWGVNFMITGRLPNPSWILNIKLSLEIQKKMQDYSSSQHIFFFSGIHTCSASTQSISREKGQVSRGQGEAGSCRGRRECRAWNDEEKTIGTVWTRTRVSWLKISVCIDIFLML